MYHCCAAFGKAQTVKSDEPESSEQGQRTGEGIQSTHRGNSSSHHSNIGNMLQILCIVSCEYHSFISFQFPTKVNGRAGSRRRSSSSARSGAEIEASHNGKRGMVLPFDQHSITFDDIIYSVDMPQVTQVINISTFILGVKRIRKIFPPIEVFGLAGKLSQTENHFR